MTTTKAQIRASEKYHAKLDTIVVRTAKDKGAEIRSAAAASGVSLQAYILEAVQKQIDARGTAGKITVSLDRDVVQAAAGDRDPAEYLRDIIKRGLQG